MKDLFGKDIYEGCKVITTVGPEHLNIAVVQELTTKKVRIDDKTFLDPQRIMVYTERGSSRYELNQEVLTVENHIPVWGKVTGITFRVNKDDSSVIEWYRINHDNNTYTVDSIYASAEEYAEYLKTLK